MVATDEVCFVVLHREHFIVRLDWIFNRVCPTGKEYVQSDAVSGDIDVPRVFNHDHRVGVRVEIVSVDNDVFGFTSLSVGVWYCLSYIPGGRSVLKSCFGISNF
jgi:hypothetical protein